MKRINWKRVRRKATGAILILPFCILVFYGIKMTFPENAGLMMAIFVGGTIAAIAAGIGIGILSERG